jgi:hypothetical protein
MNREKETSSPQERELNYSDDFIAGGPTDFGYV